MKILIIIFSLFCFSSTIAQREGDKIVLGGTGPAPSVPFKNNILYVNENYGLDSVDGTQYLNMPLYDLNQSSSTFWKDSISYTSNGYTLVNHRGEIIDNNLYGDSYIDTGQHISSISQNALFLNIKHKGVERIFLFYGQYKWDLFPYFSQYEMIYDTVFSFAELNPYNANPLQSLISKNNVLLSNSDSTTRGSIVACRHANGRDWWIFKPGLYINKYYRGLLSPYGINMEPYFTNENNERSLGTFYCHFSSDGKKFIAQSDNPPEKKVYVYDFDRCTGELSNRQVHDVTSFLFGTLYYSCLSPDGSKMYFYRYPFIPNNGNIAIIQYDFETQQTYTIIEGNGLVPFTSPNGKQVCFFTVKLDSTQSISPRYLSVINSPNKFGAACELELYVQEIPNIVGFVPPNHANFRLGPLLGSECDSLGLSVPMVEELPFWSLYPNPNRGQFTISHPNIMGGIYVICHIMGQKVASGKLQGEQTNIQTENLSPGLYIIYLSDEKGQSLGSKKWVKTEN